MRIPIHIFTSSLYSNVTTSTRINSTSVHTYICVCFIQNVSNFQHGVRIEAVFASLQQGEHTELNPSCILQFCMIEFSKEEEKRSKDSYYSVFEYSVFQSVSSISTHNPRKGQNFQDISKEYYKAHPAHRNYSTYKASSSNCSPCIQAFYMAG